ncbi:MAG: hypothetical protein IT369_03340 [Candidatus Latescibacteria bacterium]|nr:hypothetical protein [Candidatus Latescibacterota bacterium]
MHRARLALIALVLGHGIGVAQSLTASFEEQVRQQMRKLDTWGLRRLLQEEQQIDKVQKERARLSTSPRELTELASDEDSEVRFFVAVNRNTPIEVVQVLATDPEAQVRSGVAIALNYEPLGPRSEEGIIEGLALSLTSDPQVLVRLKLAENRELPGAAYEALAGDPDLLVRLRIAQNPQSSSTALAHLAQDSVEAVLVSALGHRNMPVEWLEKSVDQPLPPVRLAIAQNINTPVGVLERLAADPAPEVRRAVARHANTTLAILDHMRADQDLEVLLALVAHPRADRKLLTKLARDDRDAGVRLAAQKRLVPLLRQEIREDLMERWRTQ